MNYHFVRERVFAKVLEVRFIGSKDQIADLLTKPLPRPAFETLRVKLTEELPLRLRGRIKEGVVTSQLANN